MSFRQIVRYHSAIWFVFAIIALAVILPQTCGCVSQEKMLQEIPDAFIVKLLDSSYLEQQEVFFRISISRSRTELRSDYMTDMRSLEPSVFVAEKVPRGAHVNFVGFFVPRNKEPPLLCPMVEIVHYVNHQGTMMYYEVRKEEVGVASTFVNPNSGFTRCGYWPTSN